MNKEYQTRLIELGRKVKESLDKCKNMAITDEEKIAVSDVNYLLGYIESLSTP